MDNTHIKKLCGDIAHKVIKFGVCYGIIIEGEDGMLFQELPPEYCRVRYSINNLPAVEFNMAYFDEHFHDINYRLRVLKMFPKDVQRGYLLYKEGKLAPDFVGDVGSWYLLEPGTAVKFSLNGLGDLPIFYNMIPSLLTLDAAQDLDQRKQMQDLLKIIVQKLPLDKNGDLLFDVSEAMDLHNNAVAMLQHAIGTDIITTFCDIDSIDLSDTRDNDSDDLERVERSVYNAAGVPEDLFNSSSNLSLNSSILRTAGIMQDLKLQFETMFDSIIQHRHETTRKSYKFKFYILDTTQYNYTEFSKMYKDQMQVGYGKLFAQIALGHSQSSILSTIYFENKVLDLSQIMIPPLTSATINGEDIQNLGKTSSTNKKKTQTTTEGATSSDNTGGRPKKDERELSDKSIQNRESQ